MARLHCWRRWRSSPRRTPASGWRARARLPALLDATAAPKGGPLTVWLGGILAQATPGSSYRKWYDQEIAAFSKQYPGTTVKTVLLDPDGVKQTAQYRAAFGGGQHIDVAMMYPGGYTTGFASSLLDLRTAAPAVLKQYNPGLLAYGCDKFNCAKGSPEYLAPFDVSGWVLGYNKKIFAKLGIKAPFKDWNALVAAGKKMKAAGYVPFQMGNRDGYMADAYLSNMESSYLKPTDIAAVLGEQAQAHRREVRRSADQVRRPVQAGARQPGRLLARAARLAARLHRRQDRYGRDLRLREHLQDDEEQPGNHDVARGQRRAERRQRGPGRAGRAGLGHPEGHEERAARRRAARVPDEREGADRAVHDRGRPARQLEGEHGHAPDPASGQAAKYFQQATILSLDSAMPLRTQNEYFKITNLALCGKTSPEDAMKTIQDVFSRENR